MPNRFVTAAVLALAAFGAAAAWAASSPFVGQWHWNRAESSITPGEALPSDVVLAITSVEPSRVQWTVTTVDDKGARHVESFTGAADGKPAPLSGSEDGTTVAVALHGSVLETTYANPDGSSEHEACSVAADGKKMTCKGSESDGKGHTQSYVDVYDRQ